jgi:hypothetical protein
MLIKHLKFIGTTLKGLQPNMSRLLIWHGGDKHMTISPFLIPVQHRQGILGAWCEFVKNWHELPRACAGAFVSSSTLAACA